MGGKRLGARTLVLQNRPAITGHACAVGKMEGEGPLRDSFDAVEQDARCGMKSWEQAESALVKKAFRLAAEKAGVRENDPQLIFAGDLLNQCIGTGYGLRNTGVPHLGLYGACSTMAESLLLAAVLVDGGYADTAAAVTSSHFCTAERQFRMPLDYGGQRPPTAQWTVTGSGAAIVRNTSGRHPRVTHVTPGVIVDAGIKDANNMGAAMAPAAYDTIRCHLKDRNLSPRDFDLIVTGDLGSVGGGILVDWFRKDGTDISSVYADCGLLIFDPKRQDVHAGGSGCGCSASVLCGYLLNGMRQGRWKRILFAATGALMSTTASQQGESIPSVSHAVSIEMGEG